MIRIATDSCANISFEEADKLGITVLPQTINFGEESYLDGIEISRQGFYERLLKTKKLPTTSQPSPATFENLYNEVKNAGDELILITISSKLSGTYQCAEMVRNDVGYDGIHVIDSMHLVEGEKILALEAVKHRDTLTAKEIVNKIEDLKRRLKVYAILDTLEYLHRGGRLSRSVALIGALLNIKPIANVIEGNVNVAGKQRGTHRAINFVAEQTELDGIDYDYPVFFGYSYDKANCKLLTEKLAKDPASALDKAENLAPIVGTHIGPNAAYMVFFAANPERFEKF